MTSFVPSGRYWITTENQSFQLSDGTMIVVPANYLFNGHSIPPFLFFMERYSYDSYAALLHDYLYETQLVPRHIANKEYLILMKRLGTKATRRYTFYLAVRLFGWIWWYLNKV